MKTGSHTSSHTAQCFQRRLPADCKQYYVVRLDTPCSRSTANVMPTSQSMEILDLGRTTHS
ncbi:hypothetical protein C0J52_14557 [Blattella germanica]|nr:hypothetical protein C0J52_14557 [Blattella germanica]